MASYSLRVLKNPNKRVSYKIYEFGAFLSPNDMCQNMDCPFGSSAIWRYTCSTTYCLWSRPSISSQGVPISSQVPNVSPLQYSLSDCVKFDTEWNRDITSNCWSLLSKCILRKVRFLYYMLYFKYLFASIYISHEFIAWRHDVRHF